MRICARCWGAWGAAAAFAVLATACSDDGSTTADQRPSSIESETSPSPTEAALDGEDASQRLVLPARSFDNVCPFTTAEIAELFPGSSIDESIGNICNIVGPRFKGLIGWPTVAEFDLSGKYQEALDFAELEFERSRQSLEANTEGYQGEFFETDRPDWGNDVRLITRRESWRRNDGVAFERVQLRTVVSVADGSTTLSLWLLDDEATDDRAEEGFEAMVYSLADGIS